VKPFEREKQPGKGARPFRCTCGSLLARLVRDGLELKCRKCKRQIVVPLTEKKSWAEIDL
jgi:phage FluMu protein Com